jgi:hypothetical protein
MMSQISKNLQMLLSFIISIARILKYKAHVGGLPYSAEVLEGTLYILGTGPSLKIDLTRNLSIFQKSEVLVVNDFALDFYYIKIRPRFYVFADPGYWLDENLTTENNISIRKELFNSIISNTTWDLKIYAPKFSISFFNDVFKANKNISIASYNSIDLADFESYWGQYCLKRNFAAPCQNVVGTSIYLSVNMGYKSIKIYGVDHSWTEDLRVDNHNRVCAISKHFYDNDYVSNFIPWLKVNNQMYKMHEILSDLSKTFYYYFIINKYARSKNSTVYNCSSRSFIDAFIRQ